MYYCCPEYKQKGFAHIFALVGIVIIAVVAGELYYLSSNKPTQPAKQEQNASSAPKQESQVSNLFNEVKQIPKTITAQQPEFGEYSNKDLGFGLKFTTSLHVSVDSEDEYNKRNNGDNRKNFTGYVHYEPGKFLGAVVVLDKTNSYDTNPLTVWVFDNPDNMTPTNWFGRYWYYPFLWGVFDYASKAPITPDQEASVSGQPAIYKVVSYQPGKPKYIYLSNNGKMYLLRVIGDSGDQILATFKLQ